MIFLLRFEWSAYLHALLVYFSPSLRESLSTRRAMLRSLSTNLNALHLQSNYFSPQLLVFEVARSARAHGDEAPEHHHEAHAERNGHGLEVAILERHKRDASEWTG